MKWFNDLMSTNKGRLFWLLIIIGAAFIPVPQAYDYVTTILVIILGWIAVYHLSNKLNVKHKKLWRIMAIFLSASVYIIFLIVKRKQLRTLSA
jgi:hypothetical protein